MSKIFFVTDQTNVGFNILVVKLAKSKDHNNKKSKSFEIFAKQVQTCSLLRAVYLQV